MGHIEICTSVMENQMEREIETDFLKRFIRIWDSQRTGLPFGGALEEGA